jgi:hypothetical protein
MPPIMCGHTTAGFNLGYTLTAALRNTSTFPSKLSSACGVQLTLLWFFVVASGASVALLRDHM